MDTNDKSALLDTINMKKAIIYRMRAEMASAVQNVNAIKDKEQTAMAQAEKIRSEVKAMKKAAPAKRDPKKAEELKSLSKKYGGQGNRLLKKK